MAERGRAFRGTMFRAISQSVSFNAFYRSAREHGIAYRRGDMLADWAEVKNEVLNRKALQGVPTDVVPPHVELTESKIKYSQPFVYKARVEVAEKETGVRTEQFVTILSRKALTLEQVESQIYRKWSTWQYGKKERIATVEPTAALHYIS